MARLIERALESVGHVEAWAVTELSYRNRSRTRTPAGATQKVQRRSPVVAGVLQRLSHLGRKMGIGGGRKPLPFAQERLTMERTQIRDADKVPFGFGADVDELRLRILVELFPSFFGAEIAGVAGCAGRSVGREARIDHYRPNKDKSVRGVRKHSLPKSALNIGSLLSEDWKAAHYRR